MQTEEQIRRRQQAVRNQRIKKLIMITGVSGLVCGFLVGILITVLIARNRANKVEEAYSQQIEKKEKQTTDLKDQLSKFQESREERIKSSKWNMILVNEEYPLDDSFQVELADLEDEYQVDARIVEDAKEMLKAGRDEGMNLAICSAYRDNDKQKSVFNQTIFDWLEQDYSYLDAYNETKKSVALPGTSEHATGLALDIVSSDYPELDEKQANTKEAKWLADHCAEYGFILRFPPEKADVTGIIYEPWHYRYVGKKAAKEIMKEGITLEEYYE